MFVLFIRILKLCKIRSIHPLNNFRTLSLSLISTKLMCKLKFTHSLYHNHSLNLSPSPSLNFKFNPKSSFITSLKVKPILNSNLNINSPNLKLNPNFNLSFNPKLNLNSNSNLNLSSNPNLNPYPNPSIPLAPNSTTKSST